MGQIPLVTLNDGLVVPAIGFGTVGFKGSQGAEIIERAISEGYRLIDTAYNYENEGAVGEAIRRSPVPRQELFVTSKLPGRYHAYEQAVQAIQESLYRAGLDYFDLYLIHWPNPVRDQYMEAWRALLDAKKYGLIRSVGVSNFLPEHIERLKEESGELPSINQIELHPFFNQEKQRQYHDKNQIITESWSPLGKARALFDDEVIQEISERNNKTVSQIILRWHVQLGALPIPKSSSVTHRKHNLEIFDFTLTNEDMNQLNGLTKEKGRVSNYDPTTYEEL